MSKWLVLGLGNTLSGADAFGPAVVEALRSAPGLPPDVDLIDGHTDLSAHLDRFTEHDGVILVDVVLTTDGAPVPGGNRVAIVSEETFSTWDGRSTGAHELAPLMWVRLFRQLYAAAKGPEEPVIALVALLTTAQEFQKVPSAADIAAGADAVQRLVSAPLA